MGARRNWGLDPNRDLPEAWGTLLGRDTYQRIQAISSALTARPPSEHIVPPPHHVFRALQTPPDRVKVIIIGQDPYPTPGHATGLAFSVPDGVWPLPPTLKNIMRELVADTGIIPPRHGNLASWHRQGVLLLNRHLTTVAGSPGAHQGLGWAAITDDIVAALAAQNPHRVAILWGREAESVRGLLGDIPAIVCAHPSPLSAFRGFFGSRPFSRANEYLERMGLAPIDWSLDPATGCQPGEE